MEEERSLVTHVEAQLTNLQKIRGCVQNQLKEEQRKQKDRYDDKLKRLTLFSIGDKILYYNMILDNQRSQKLAPKWKGPFFIHNIIGNGAYKIRDLTGKVFKAPVNGKFLKLYKDPFDKV